MEANQHAQRYFDMQDTFPIFGVKKYIRLFPSIV